MKSFKIIISTILLLSFWACDRELPYADRAESVVVDVIRISGTKGIIEEGILDGNYQIKLTIPSQQGDYSDLDYVQFVCVFTPAKNPTVPYPASLSKFPTAIIVKDNLQASDLDKPMDIDLEDIYKKLGLSTPQLGEELNFTINVILKDGKTYPGWVGYLVDDGKGGERMNEVYNNMKFVGWILGDRNFSYKVKYAVVCPFVVDDYVGTLLATDGTTFYGGQTYNVTVEKGAVTEKNVTLKVSGMLEEPDYIYNIIISLEDYSVTVPKTILDPIFTPYTDFYISGNGDVNTCNRSVNLKLAVGVAEGTFHSANSPASWSMTKK